jgi:hypothetical protein
MDLFQWLCLLFVALCIGSFAYEAGFKRGLLRGAELARELEQHEGPALEEIDVIATRLPRELKEAREELERRRCK